MKDVITTNRFKKDLRRLKRWGMDLNLLKKVIDFLKENDNVPELNRPHLLSGDWEGYWECHIKADRLLIYSIDVEDNSISLYRSGTHSDLF